jgi:Zn-finger nucleic acid-binding protein
MNCPACASPLVVLKVEGLCVDVCRSGCGGVWFDNFELKRVDEAHDKLGEALAALEFNPTAIVLPAKRPCPKCAGITMLQHKFSREKPVLVDECPNCGGVWLDGGELTEIRRAAPTAEDHKKARQQFLSQLFNQELAQLKARRSARSGN